MHVRVTTCSIVRAFRLTDRRMSATMSAPSRNAFAKSLMPERSHAVQALLLPALLQVLQRPLPGGDKWGATRVSARPVAGGPGCPERPR